MIWSYIGLTGLLDLRHTVYSLSKDWSTPLASVGQFFYISLLVVVVGCLAYYTTRMVTSAKFVRGGRRNLQVIESMGVGPQSFVHIVRVGGQYLLIGVTRGQVSYLAQLDEDKLALPEAGGQMLGFESLLSRFQKKGGTEGDDLGNGGNDGKDNGP